MDKAGRAERERLATQVRSVSDERVSSELVGGSGRLLTVDVSPLRTLVSEIAKLGK